MRHTRNIKLRSMVEIELADDRDQNILKDEIIFMKKEDTFANTHMN